MSVTLAKPSDLMLHAHVHTTAQDCDGRYDYSNVYAPDANESDMAFIAWAVGNFVSGPTEEGFVYHEVTLCREADRDDDSNYTFRDHTAESMGY